MTSVRMLVNKTVAGSARTAGTFVNVTDLNELRTLMVNREAVYDRIPTPQPGPYQKGARRGGKSVSVDLPSIAAGATVEVSVTVPGVVGVNDGVSVKAPVDLIAGLTFTSYVSGDNTVKLRVTNTTGAAIDAPAKNWKFWVLK